MENVKSVKLPTAKLQELLALTTSDVIDLQLILAIQESMVVLSTPLQMPALPAGSVTLRQPTTNASTSMVEDLMVDQPVLYHSVFRILSPNHAKQQLLLKIALHVRLQVLM